ncbi:MAG: hypothetical protein GX568_00065, partial [Candidatus Gastranaerophilales bacterium]|nr:hypothetical protein [Candidatus Gastranaerophilales bacterium]
IWEKIMEPTQLIAANNQNVWERFERFRNNSGGKTSFTTSIDSFTPSNKDKNKTYLKYGIGGGL